MKKILAGAAIAALGLTAGITSVSATDSPGTPSSPTSEGGVTPYIIDGANSGGNRTCAEAGAAFEATFQYVTDKVDYEGGAFDADFVWTKVADDGKDYGSVSVVTDGIYVSFTSIPGADGSVNVGAAIVKGSNDANVYYYPFPGVASDMGLASPPNASGTPAGLSNLTFCGYPGTPVVAGEWCSPGYWRQPHHLDSWEATGISPDELYSAYFDAVEVSKKALRDGAISDPTLLQVLQSPQWYGGDAFNNVGDLLSDAHPDVDFSGERIEDSCPLN